MLAAAPIISSAKEVVYLKNGSIIKGDIVEIIPNKTLNFFVEYEYTAAEYGNVEPEGTDFYKFTKDYTVGNSRFIAAVVFNF